MADKKSILARPIDRVGVDGQCAEGTAVSGEKRALSFGSLPVARRQPTICLDFTEE